MRISHGLVWDEPIYCGLNDGLLEGISDQPPK